MFPVVVSICCANVSVGVGDGVGVFLRKSPKRSNPPLSAPGTAVGVTVGVTPLAFAVVRFALKRFAIRINKRIKTINPITNEMNLDTPLI